MKKTLLIIAFGISLLLSSSLYADDTIKVTEENFAHAETARNFRNWVKLGANEKITHLRNLPPRGDAAPVRTVRAPRVVRLR